ncbi:MAG: hypothetical protein WCK58_16110 [Chloroflexota bacterium]
MRRRTVVAGAALIAAVALAGLPGPAGSQSPSAPSDLAPAAFTTVTVNGDSPAQRALGTLDAGLRSDGYVSGVDSFSEPGRAPRAPSKRPMVDQPAVPTGSAWKPPKYTIRGIATFYGNGTTAMRLPRGTVVRICGAARCIERTVSDYGPQKPSRVVDLYTPDFFAICGCPSWSGTTFVTVGVY